jgi:hypothetical protein
MISLFMWGVAIAIIIVYGFVIYWLIDGSRLGFVTMFAVFTTDVILYLLYNAKIVQSSTLLSVTAILNRFFLFIFGGDYWIYGYMILYIYYGCILAYVIGERRFPFENAYAEINLDNIARRQHTIDLTKIPEFVLAFITSILIILFIVMVAVKP